MSWRFNKNAKKPVQWPGYRIVPYYAYGKWAVEKERDGLWIPLEYPLDLEDAKKLIIHLIQGPIYPPFNPDHS